MEFDEPTTGMQIIRKTPENSDVKDVKGIPLLSSAMRKKKYYYHERSKDATAQASMF